uniref:Uncharacterized protein n=1 Tax=Rhizophora mucronata TaxID=61149 RepID=A0A2P2R0C1_RHIMU
MAPCTGLFADLANP